MNFKRLIIEDFLKFVYSNEKLVCYGINDGVHIATFLKEHINRTFDAFLVDGDVPSNASYLGIPLYNVNSPHVRFYGNSNCGCILTNLDESKAYLIPQLKNMGFASIYFAPHSLSQIIIGMVLSKNAEVQNTATKDRCFIMATGPSLLTQDLTLLEGEDVFTCSYCNLIKSYDVFKPKYYVKPGAVNDGHDTEYIVECLRYMDESITSDIFFLDYNDKPFIEQYGLLKGKKVYYLLQNTQWLNNATQIYPLNLPSPSIWTASVMMLKVALYMGYKKIYLIGTEHSVLSEADHTNAYDPEKLSDVIKYHMYRDNQCSTRSTLYALLNVFNEYYFLHNIAKANGVEIFNATNGGILDVFPRVNFESLF